MIRVINPFRTAVPFWGQSSQISSSFVPKRDCGSKGVKLRSESDEKKQEKQVKQELGVNKDTLLQREGIFSTSTLLLPGNKTR